ncbi:hypothetical protein DRW41_12935 [Neobacillus piezotolerans]|uniref:Uncharacterized protein n=1 Tax=Neobacillus piezotolerans TaxID=2259171 RepID=A0A3D8GQ73_9BACI|nr:hypothetical protein [Neobacillus piezotolerans]RDU36432.1 hypothetical protein DRW41_12935 [Neobacillus piezotolerans]
MYKKVCNECSKPSYSSCETGTWLCPVCGADITRVNLQAPETRGMPGRLQYLATGFPKEAILSTERELV